MLPRRRPRDVVAAEDAFTFADLSGSVRSDGVELLRAASRGDAKFENGAPSPPLWKGSQSPTHQRAAAVGVTPRAQVIAAYRREMLDMVRALPESAYELSLRDIVEPDPHHPSRGQHLSMTVDEMNGKEMLLKMKSRLKKNLPLAARGISRSSSMDSAGTLIKMYVPMIPTRRGSFGGPARYGNAWLSSAAGQKDKGSETASSSRTSSTGSSSSGGFNPPASRTRKRSGCFGFLRRRRGESEEE